MDHTDGQQDTNSSAQFRPGGHSFCNAVASGAKTLLAAPKQVFPGEVVFITARTHNRELRFQPTPEVNAVIEYLLGHYAEEYGLQLFGYCLEGSHLHIPTRDPHGNQVAFRTVFFSVPARELNRIQGLRDHVFTGEESSAIPIRTQEDLLAKILYTESGPVKDLLVARGCEWLGVNSYGRSPGVKHLPKPGTFFAGNSSLPEASRLVLHKPSEFGVSDEEWMTLRKEGMARAEAKARMKCRQEGRTPMGMAKVLAASPTDRPKSKEALRGRRPRTVSQFPKVRRTDYLIRLKFVREHREKRLELRRQVRTAGNRRVRSGSAVIFPAGTYNIWREGLAHRLASPTKGRLPTYAEWLGGQPVEEPTRPRDG